MSDNQRPFVKFELGLDFDISEKCEKLKFGLMENKSYGRLMSNLYMNAKPETLNPMQPQFLAVIYPSQKLRALSTIAVLGIPIFHSRNH